MVQTQCAQLIICLKVFKSNFLNSLFAYNLKDSVFSGGQIRIQLLLEGWIRIRLHLGGRIQIRLHTTRTRNPALFKLIIRFCPCFCISNKWLTWIPEQYGCWTKAPGLLPPRLWTRTRQTFGQCPPHHSISISVRSQLVWVRRSLR